jgi:predicted DCC family thiol-disulfide oxidoreductase YuxK
MIEPDILYYDGSCPLCRREMAHLERLKSAGLLLQNIHDLQPEADTPDQASLLKSLHLRRGNTWIIGLDANIAAWQHTRVGCLWRCLSWPIVKPAVNWLYQLWAERRFAKRYPNHG